MSAELVIRAIGRCARQGSKSPKGHTKDGRCILVEADPNLPQWRTDVITAAKTAMRAHGSWVMLDGPIEAWCVFVLPRPPSVTREWPESQNDGDGDKYVRAVFDALTLAKVWTNDARVVRHHAEKIYAKPGQAPGARIVVRSLATQLAVI